MKSFDIKTKIFFGDQALDRLADVVREHVDMSAIYRNMGL